jgi:hypothetical protein
MNVAIPQEILAMKARVKEMEEEAAKLRELQAAAAAADDSSVAPMETDEDRAAADGRSVYVGNVRLFAPFRLRDAEKGTGRLRRNAGGAADALPSVRVYQPDHNPLRQVHWPP